MLSLSESIRECDFLMESLLEENALTIFSRTDDSVSNLGTNALQNETILEQIFYLLLLTPEEAGKRNFGKLALTICSWKNRRFLASRAMFEVRYFGVEM